jgi:GT2 family glycosyltransferase
MNYLAASYEVSHFRDFIDFIEASFEEYYPMRFRKRHTSVEFSLPMVSIIIQSWNTLKYTKLAITSILKNSPNSSEIIIVDNGSSDGSPSFLKSVNDSRIKLILNRNNIGYIEANKQAYEKCKGDLICLVNSDVIVPPNWLFDLTTSLLNQWDDGARIAGPIQISKKIMHPYFKNSNLREIYDKMKKIQFETPDERFYFFSSGRDIETFADDIVNYNKIGIIPVCCPPDFLSGSCILISRSLINEIGFFMHPILQKYGSDDVFLCWYASRHGYKVLRVGNVYVHHFKHVSIFANNFDRNNYISTSNNYLFFDWAEKLESYVKQKISEGKTWNELSDEFYMLYEYKKWKNNLISSDRIPRILLR